MELHNRFALSPHEVTHPGRQGRERASAQRFLRCGAHLLAHANHESALDDGDLFDGRMVVRGNALAVRQFQAKRERSRFRRIAAP